MNHRAYIFSLILLATGCATFYEVNYEFNKNFEAGNLQAAELVLEDNRKEERSKTRFLYYANWGVVTHLLGKYNESNEWLERAFVFGEDYQINYLNHAASYFLNPNLIIYPGEDHEHLMLLYYKALNYLKIGDYDAALVECRRLNNRLFQLGDKYRSENKYRRDAFVHNLMGLVYEATGDFNNAFIAYRNSLEIYENDYKNLFQLETPDQLKEDLMRTAYRSGFLEELEQYEKKFGYEFKREVSEGGYLIFFWHNGLAPVKDEWSITFVAVDGGNGRIFFENEALGLSFPYAFNSDDYDQDFSMTDLSGFRVAFPKYVERKPYFDYGDLEVNGRYYTLEKAQDINKIAFKVLNERMLQELGKGLLRVAVKKAVEKQIRKESEGLAFLVSALNVATTQADTRNWQTLPHSIHYTRVPLKEGKNTVEIYTDGPRSESSQTFTFVGKPGETQFHAYQSLESQVAF